MALASAPRWSPRVSPADHPADVEPARTMPRRSSTVPDLDLVLLIFSTHANNSPYVLREVDRAVAYKLPLLALRVDETVPSSSIEYYVHAVAEVRGHHRSSRRSRTSWSRPCAKR